MRRDRAAAASVARLGAFVSRAGAISKASICAMKSFNLQGMTHTI
jgi:hypothetical protein